MLTDERICSDSILDIMSGSSGALYKQKGQRDLLAQANRGGEHLLAWNNRSIATISGKFPADVSHGTSGIAYSLSSLFHETGNEHIKKRRLQRLNMKINSSKERN